MFDRSSAEPWPIDVLTLEHRFSGTVEAPAQKWGWSYFQVYGQRPASPLALSVTSVEPTGAGSAPASAVGRIASFAWDTALVALIPRGPAADAVWDKWNSDMKDAAAEVLTGPYAVTGRILSSDGQAGTPAIASAFAMRDAVFTRVDGQTGTGPIEAPRAVLTTAFLQAIVTV